MDAETSRRTFLRVVPTAFGLAGVSSTAGAVQGRSTGTATDVSCRSGGSSRQPLERVGELTADDGDHGDEFGSAVDLWGDTAIVGAFGDEDPNGSTEDEDLGAGSAYVFEREADGWSQQAKLAPEDGDPDDTFGFSVAVWGDTALVGAPREEDPTGSGAAYLFERDGGEWTQQRKLAAQPAPELGSFGWSVALGDGTAIVGAQTGEPGEERFPGPTYVFGRDDGQEWLVESTLTPSGVERDERFGWSIAHEGDTVVVGSPRDRGINSEPGGSETGAAYVFVREGRQWRQQGRLTPGRGSVAGFGSSVAVSGDTALVGPGPDSGVQASLYERSGDAWSLRTTLAPSEGAPCSVALSGGTALVEADEAVPAEVFERGDGGWTRSYRLDVSGHESPSRSTALTGNGALLGREDPTASPPDPAGTALVFERPGEASPRVDAGNDREVPEGASVTLDASGSGDPDGDSLSYAWKQVDGPSVSLSDAGTATPTFEAPSVDTWADLVFEVTVDDGRGEATDRTTVTVAPNRTETTTAAPTPTTSEETPTANDGQGMPGFGIATALGALGGGALWRRIRGDRIRE